MHKSIATLIAIAACLPGSAQAQTSAPFRLPPTSDWSLNYADDGCEISRRFGTGDDSVLLGLRSYQPGGEFLMIVVGELTAVATTSNSLRLAMDPVETSEQSFRQGNFGGVPGIEFSIPISFLFRSEEYSTSRRAGRPIVLWTRPEIEAQVSEIGLIDGLQQEFVMETGTLGPPLAALRECTSELSTHWTVNEATHLQMARNAKASGAFWDWLDRDNYSPELRPAGPVLYRLIVDAEGKVAECTVPGVQSPEFIEATCNQLREKASFEPALNAAGEAVPDYFLGNGLLFTTAPSPRR